MATAAENLADPELLGTEWDLEPLIDGAGEAGVLRLLDEASGRAKQFAATHAGKLAELDSAGLEAAMRELADINVLVGRAGSYVSLRFATDTAEPSRGALLQKVQERATELETTLIFFELEWAALDEDRAESLLASAGLAFCGH